jgi:hypothetical protein
VYRGDEQTISRNPYSEPLGVLHNFAERSIGGRVEENSSGNVKVAAAALQFFCGLLRGLFCFGIECAPFRDVSARTYSVAKDE